ncbi:MAG TPA: biotin/lipoyl-containing protein, partial [Actinomycetota bacterium]
MPEREFKLPDLGEGLTEGEVVRWLVKEGDAVTLNQPIVEVETAKAVVEIPAPYAGTVVKLHAGEGDTLDVGAPLLSVDTGGGSGAAAAEPAAQPEPERQATLVGPGERQQVRRRRATRPGGAATGPAPTGPPQQRPKATPPVRKYAKDHGVDLATITGTGKDGRVTHEDVDRALEPAAEPAAA